MNTQIVLQFLSLKGLSTEFVRENKKNLLSIAVELHGQLQETSKFTILDEVSKYTFITPYYCIILLC